MSWKNIEENAVKYAPLFISAGGATISGVTTKIGIEAFLFSDPILSIMLAVFIQSSIVVSSFCLHRVINKNKQLKISTQSNSNNQNSNTSATLNSPDEEFKASKSPYFTVLILSASFSMGLSSVGAYETFGYRENQNLTMITTDTSDHDANAEKFEKYQIDVTPVVEKKLEELTTSKTNLTSTLQRTRKTKTRDWAAKELDKISGEVKKLAEISAKLKQLSFAKLNFTEVDTSKRVTQIREQKADLNKSIQSLKTLHNMLPKQIQEAVLFPNSQVTNPPPVNQLSAFWTDLQAQKITAIVSVTIGIIIDLICIFFGLAGAKIPSLPELITAFWGWLSRMWKALNPGKYSSVLSFFDQMNNHLSDVTFTKAKDNLFLDDLENSKEMIEQSISRKRPFQVQITEFRTPDGKPFVSDRSLVTQMAGSKEFIVVVI